MFQSSLNIVFLTTEQEYFSVSQNKALVTLKQIFVEKSEGRKNHDCMQDEQF